MMKKTATARIAVRPEPLRSTTKAKIAGPSTPA